MAHIQSKVAENAQTNIQINWTGVRGNREPLDSSSVMLSYTELLDYVKTNKTIYDGQIVSVSDTNYNEQNGPYYISYWQKDYNGNNTYVAHKIALNEFNTSLRDDLIRDEEVISLINNYTYNNSIKNEETISFAINYLYSYITNNNELFTEKVEETEKTLCDVISYIFKQLDETKNIIQTTIDELPTLSVDLSKNSFLDKDGNKIYLKFKPEEYQLYLDKYEYPVLTSLQLINEEGNNISNQNAESGTNINIKVSGIKYNYTGSAQIQSLVVTNGDNILLNIPNPDINGTFYFDTPVEISGDIGSGEIKIKGKITDSEEEISEKTSTVNYSHWNWRYTLIGGGENLTDIDVNTTSYEINTLDKNTGKKINNLTLPKSEDDNQHIYFLFKSDSNPGNYTSCILNGASPSDNLTIYGPIKLKNSSGYESDYYYWKKILGSTAETVTLQ